MTTTVEINGEAIPVWPADQVVETFCEQPIMAVTDWRDTAKYHDRLIGHILELEQHSELVHRMPIGGAKIRDVEAWGTTESQLLCERVLALYRHVSSRPARIDLAWANVSRRGDYLSPHSHDISEGSVVYMLDPGDPPTAAHPFSGALVFVDPRIPACCPKQADCVNNEFNTGMKAGSMIMFPSPLVHFVHPYMGERERITVAFNLSPA